TQTYAVQKQLDDLAATFDGSGKPAMEANAFTDLCNVPFKVMLAISFEALDQAKAHVETKQGGALWVLITAMAGLAVTLVL
ncbi:MAG: methyl-accepting chemotaxis protein, partial [Rhodospirillaceae bacterium]|nr:methyl-accepting chemotaxis protein [Rhodospirillaceae bacterium]